MTPLDDRFQHVLPRRLDMAAGLQPQNTTARYSGMRNDTSNQITQAAAAAICEPSSVADRARRILSLVRDIETQAANLVLTVRQGGHPDGACTKDPTPEPSHLVFALEDAERRLQNSRDMLSEALQAIG